MKCPHCSQEGAAVKVSSLHEMRGSEREELDVSREQIRHLASPIEPRIRKPMSAGSPAGCMVLAVILLLLMLVVSEELGMGAMAGPAAIAVVVFAVFFYGTGLASDLEEKYRGFSSLSLERFRRATERWNQLCFCAACQSVFLEGDGFAPVEETQSFVYESGPPLHEIAKLQQQVSYKQAIVYTAYACMFPIWIGGFVLQGMDFSTLNVGELAELAPLALLTLVLPTIGVFVVLSRRQALREHPEGGAQMAVQKEGSIGSAIVWMVVISLLLFWLPVVGPFVAGLVGGKKAGGVGAAIVAVFLPSIILGGALFLLTGALVGVPIVGAIAGMGAFALSLAGVGPLLVGAIIGGLLA